MNLPERLDGQRTEGEIKAISIRHVTSNTWPVQRKKNRKDLPESIPANKDRAASHSMTSMHVTNEETLGNVVLLQVVGRKARADLGLAHSLQGD